MAVPVRNDDDDGTTLHEINRVTFVEEVRK